MAASTCAWTDGVTVSASVNTGDAVTDVDAVTGADTEAEAEAVVLAISNDAFPISNYRLQTTWRCLSRSGEDFLTLPPYADTSTRH